MEVQVEENEEGNHHWVLVERVAGQVRRVEVSIHQFMTADGARDEGRKAMLAWRQAVIEPQRRDS